MSGNYRIRDLDPGERFIWLLDRISCANFLVMAELSGHPIFEETLRRALDTLQASHPLLSARIQENADGSIAFFREEGSRIPLRIEDVSVEDGEKAIEREFSATFPDPALPLVRCLLLRTPERSVLSLTFHHAIGDARSGTVLLRDLLRCCLRGAAPAAFAEVPPPMHALFPPQFRWREQPEKAEALGQQIRSEFLRHGLPSALPFLDHREARREPRLRSIRMEPAQGLALQERCRQEDTSVHGAICAAHLIATRGLFGDEDPRALYLMCPVDLRAHLTSDITGQLSYCTTFLRSSYLAEGPDAFWQLAREIGSDLKQRMQRGDGHLAYAGLPLDKIGGSGPSFDAFAGNVEQLPAGSNISNIGRVSIVEDCPEVTALSFALCSLANHLASLNVSSYADQLIVNMTFDAAKLPAAMADRLALDLQALLEQAALPQEVRA